MEIPLIELKIKIKLNTNLSDLKKDVYKATMHARLQRSYMVMTECFRLSK